MFEKEIYNIRIKVYLVEEFLEKVVITLKIDILEIGGFALPREIILPSLCYVIPPARILYRAAKLIHDSRIASTIFDSRFLIRNKRKKKSKKFKVIFFGVSSKTMNEELVLSAAILSIHVTNIIRVIYLSQNKNSIR